MPNKDLTSHRGEHYITWNGPNLDGRRGRDYLKLSASMRGYYEVHHIKGAKTGGKLTSGTRGALNSMDLQTLEIIKERPEMN